MSDLALASIQNNSYRLPGIVQLGERPYQFVPKLQRQLGFIPQKPRNYLLELFLTGSFIEAIHQTIQQVLIDLIPKALVGGTLRAKSNDANTNSSSAGAKAERPTIGKLIEKFSSGSAIFNKEVALDEVIAECLEYFVVYFLPTLTAIGLLGRMIGGIVGNNYEFLGQPMHIYEKNLNRTVQVGRVNNKTLKIDELTLGKIGLGKTMLFAAITTFCSAVAFATPSIRTFLTNWIFGTENYSELLGFENNLAEDRNFDSLKNASNIIKKSFLVAGASVPAFLGLTWALNKNMHRPSLQKFFRRTAKHFDLDSPFGLSRSFVAPTIMTIAFGYYFGSRGSSEKIETWNRAVLYAAPAVIFYKQLVVSLLTSLSSVFFGTSQDLPHLISQMWGQIKQGERDPLNWHFTSDFKENPQTGEYEGLITKLPSVKNLRPAKQKQFFKLLGFIKNLPYPLALLVGFTVNWHNFIRIFEQHQNGSQKNAPALAHNFTGLTAQAI